MHRVNVGLMCLLSVSFAGSAYGQTPDGPQSTSPGVATLQTPDPVGTATYDSYSGGATLGAGSYLNVRHMTGPGVGYTSSYTQFGGFIPLWMNDNVFVAPDLRLNLTNNSQTGANLGLVSRYYIQSLDRTVGGYGYYDLDQSSSNNVYSQTTFGLESLGNWFDVRGNAYLPTGTQDNYVSMGPGICVQGNPYFSGHNINFQGVQGQNREVAAGGADFEIGMPLSRQTPWLRGYVGAYFYHANQQSPVSVDDPIPSQKSHNPSGFRGRVDAWLTEDLMAGVNVTTDPVWGTNVNAVVDFRFSGFKPTRYFPQWTTRQRMLNPVQRNWRIAVENYGTAVNTNVAAVDPNSGNPYFVDFINSAAPAGGDGTYEHPFSLTNLNNFHNNPNVNVIIVDRGTSTAAHPYTGSIQLFNNQQLLGEGAKNVAPVPLSAAFGDCSVNGNFQLPGINGSGDYPFVSNSASNPIVTLADNNQVAGFNFINSGGDAIYGNNVKNFNLHDLEITGNAGRGIALTNATGATTVISNINTGVADNLNPNGYGNNKGGGILLTTGLGGISNLQLTNIKMNSSPAGTQPFGISLTAANGPLTFTETNVMTNGNGTGQSFTEVGQALIGSLNGVTSNNNVADGLDVTGTGGSVAINSTNATTPLLTNGNGGSGVVFTMNGGTGLMNLTGAQGNNNGVDGLGIFASGGTTTTVNIVNGQYNSNMHDGINHQAAGGSTLSVNVDPTSINLNGQDGIFFKATGNSTLIDSFANDTINSSTRSAIYGTMDASKAKLTFTNVQGTSSLQNSFHLDAANGSSFLATVAQSDFSAGHLNGLDVQLAGKSSATFNLTNVNLNGSGQNAASFLAATGSQFTLNANATTFNGSGANGILATAHTGSTGTINVTSGASSISQNKGDGVLANATGLSNINASFDSTAINNNLGNGVQFTLDNSPSSSLTMTGLTTVNTNSINGIQVDASTGSVFTPTLNGTTIKNNGQDGVLMNANSGSSIAAGTITKSTIQNNGANGFETNITGLNSSGNLLFNSTQITNNSQTGFLFTSSAGGQLTAGFAKGSALNNNGANAVNGVVTGTGAAGSSSASILLDGTSARASGKNDVQLVDSQGGLLHFTAQNGASLSNSVNGAGLIVSVQDVNTTTFIDLNGAVVNANKTIGFAGTVSELVALGPGQQGAILNADLEGSSFSANGQQGIAIQANGPGAIANYGLGVIGGTPDTVNGNGQDGVLAMTQGQGQINFRSVGTSFDNNGFSVPVPGQYDGLNFQTFDGTIRALLYGGSTNFNNGDGVSVGPIPPSPSTNGADIYLSMGNTFTSKGNNGNSLNFNASGANSAYLITDAAAAPVLQGPINLNFSGVGNAVVDLNGSFQFNNQPGDGLTANFNNAQTAIFYLNGLGTSTANANGSNGLDITMSNVVNGAITIKGFSNINGNAGDGIHVGMTNVANGAVLLQGSKTNSNLSDNHASGINVQLNNVNLVNNFAGLNGVSNLAVLGLTTTDNNPADRSVPAVVSVPVDVTGATPAKGLGVNNFTVSNSGSVGIAVDGTNTTIDNGGSISNNIVSNSTGDGIQFILNDQPGSAANGFLFNSNSSTFNNGGNGIDVQLTNVSMNNSQFQNMTGSNNSDAGINLNLVNSTMNNLDLTGAIAANANGKDGLDISLTNSSLTPSKGPSSVSATGNGGDGVNILSQNNSNIFLDIQKLTSTGNTGSGFVGDALNGSKLNISLDNGSSVSNNKLLGLSLAINGAGSSSLFNVNGLTDNGNTLQGVRADVTGGGNLDFRSVNSTYNTNGVAAGTDGVFMQVGGGGSNLITLFSGGSVQGNGRDGLYFGPSGADMTGATITASINNGIVVSGNAKDSIDFLAPNATNAALLVGGSGAATTVSGPMALELGGLATQNAIAELNGTFHLDNSAAGYGLDAQFFGAKTSLFSLNGGGSSTANGNALGGIEVAMTNSNNGSIQVTGVQSASNNLGGNGIGVSMSNIANGALDLQGNPGQTLLLNNGGNGLQASLSNVNLINNYAGAVPAPSVTILTTSSNQPAPYAVLPLPTLTSLPLAGQAPTTALTVNNFTAALNAQGGVIVDGTSINIANNSGSISNNIANGNKNGDGLQFILTGPGTNATGFLFNNNTANSNVGGDGINVGLTNVDMDNSQFKNLTGNLNSGTGISLNLANSSMNNVDLTGAISASGNNNGGLAITLDNSSVTPTTGPTSITANGNVGNGVTITETNNSNIFLDPASVTANQNTGAGFSGTATTGSTLNICLDAGSLSKNGLQGLNIAVSDPGSSGNINLTGLTLNGNTEQGLLAQVQNGATLYYRSVNSTYDNNGNGSTKYDGVDMRADGVGTTMLVLFDGGTAGSVANGGNGRDGFHFGGLTDGASMNGANLTVSLNDSVGAAANGRYALNFDANGAGNVALLPDAAHPPVFSGLTNINLMGVQNGVVELTGTFHFDNNAAGDGLSANFTNAQSVVFFLNGLGNSTADNNAGDGINLNTTNVQNMSILIEGFKSISGNGGDGIHIGMTSNLPLPTIAALELQGIAGGTTMLGNKGNGIDTQLTNVSLINNYANVATPPTVTFLTTLSNQPAPLDCLALPVTQPIDLTGFAPATGLTINNFNVTNSGLGGIILDGNDTTIATGGSISNNVVSGSKGDDGMRLSLTNTNFTNPTADGFLFNGNSSTGNTGGNGVDIALVNATMNNFSMTGALNVSSNAQDGLHFSLDNSSLVTTAGPTSVTANSNGNNGVSINEVNTSTFFIDIPTLTATANGASGLFGNAQSASILNLSVDAGSVSSNSTQGINLTATGVGSTGYINVNGLTVNGNVDQGLLTQVSAGGELNYRSANTTYSGNGVGTAQDGVDMRVDGINSTLRALFTGDAASGNGRDGFHIGGLADGSPTNGANVTVSMAGVTAVANKRNSLNMAVAQSSNAFLLMDPANLSTLNGAANLDFSSITGTALATMNGTFTFNGSAASNGLTANFSNDPNAILYVNATGASTANANALGGIAVDMTNSGSASLVVDGFTDISNNKGGDGISVKMSNTLQGAIALDGVAAGTTMTGNSGNGINVQMNNVQLANLFIPSLPVITGLTTSSNLATPSTLLPAPTTLTVPSPYSPLNAFTVDNFKVANSGLGGIIVDGTDTTIATGGGSISNNVVDGSKNGDGIRLSLHNAALTPTADLFLFTNDTSNNNVGGNGINIDLINATMNSLSLNGTTSAVNNSLDGLRINLDNSSMTPTTGPATFLANGNGQNGVEINSTNGSNIFLDFASLTANSNVAGAGFVGTATGNSTLNIGIEAGSLSTNATNGLSLTVDGASSVSNFNLGPIQSLGSAGVTVNGNTNDNLVANVTTGGTLNFRSINNTYNSSVTGNGVNMTVGANSTLRTLFYGGTANSNLTGDGYHFDGAAAGATLTTTLDGVTSKLNGGDSLYFNANGAASANLLQGSNAVTLSGPAFLDLSNLTGAGPGVVNLSGKFNFDSNAAGNGLTANFTNDTAAIFSVVDASNSSTADKNVGAGISVDMTNVTTASVLLQGFKDISKNTAGDGLDVTMTNTTTGALSLQGIAAGTTVNGNSGVGVNVTLNNVNLVNNISGAIPSTSVLVITTGSSLAAPMQNLPLPVSQTLSFAGQVPTAGFSVNNFTAGDAVNGGNLGSDGILITGTNATVANGSTFENNNASKNLAGNGIYLNLTGSTMNNLDTSGTTTVSGNGLDGLRIDLTNSNMTQLAGFTPSGTTTVVANSNVAGNGVAISAATNSSFFMDFASLTAGAGAGTGNALAGLATSSTTGSSLNICLDTGSLSYNGTQGLNISVDGTGSSSTVNLGPMGTVGPGVNVDHNTTQGLLAVVTNGGVLNYRSINSTYDTNGGNGVDMQVNGGASTLQTLFFGGEAKNNTGTGYSFVDGGGAANGDTLTVGLSGVTSSGNTVNALVFDGTGTANANLLMDPTNPSTMTGNSVLTVTGVTNEVVLQTDGLSFTNLNLTFDHATGLTSAFVSLNGDSTATINGGASITMKGLTNGSVFIDNYAQINNVAGNAVNVNIDGSTAPAGFTNAAIEVNGKAGLTPMNVGGGGTGVNVSLLDTHLINNLASSASLPIIKGLATNPPNAAANQASPFDCLPAVVTLQLNTLNVIPTNGLTISNLNITGNTGTNGISVVGTDSTIDPNGGFITGNTVGGKLTGDAIALLMTNTTGSSTPMINGLQVTGNTVNGGGAANGVGATILGDGIRIGVNNTGTTGSAVDNVNLSTNTVTGVGSDGMAFSVVNPAASVATVTNLQITGNNVTNSGQNGLNLNLQYADMTASPSPTIDNNTFSKNGNDGILANLLGTNITGLSTSGDTVDTNANNGLEINLNASSIAGWTANVGDISGNGTGASGPRNGVYVTEKNTSSVTGATFTSLTINNNGADGVNFLQTDATTATFGSGVNPILFTGGSISNNGKKTTGSGVNLNALTANSLATLNFTSETIGNTAAGGTQKNGVLYRTGDGTTVGTVNLTFLDGTINNNAVDGINATINGNTNAVPSQNVTLTGTTVSGNGSIGTLFNINNAETLNLLIQDDAGTAAAVSSNGADGVQINAIGSNTVVTTQVLNSLIKDNGTAVAGNGLTGMFDYGATGTFTFTNDTIGNTAAGGTQQDGVHLALNTLNMAPLTDVTATFDGGTQLTNNSASALYVNTVGASAVPTNGAHITFDGVTATGSGGMGVSLNASQGGLINFLAENLTTISNGALNGIYINETDANTQVSVLLTDTIVNNNGSVFFSGDGVNATVLAGATLDLEATTTGLGPASFSGNFGDGIDVLASGASSRIDIDLHNAIVGSDVVNNFAGNGLNGLKFQSFDGSSINVQAYQTTFDTNGGAGMYGTVNDTLGINTTGIVRIVGGEANDNTGSAAAGGGFNFAATNSSGGAGTTATMTAFFQADELGNGVHANGNTGYGISFVATNPNSPYGGVVGNLLMTGNNDLSNNTAGSVNVNMNGAQNAIIGLSGTFDNNTGDGIDVSLSNIVGLGLVSLQGGNTGEVFNNGGNGINVSLTDVHNGGVYIGGFTKISNNGTAHLLGAEDGIKVTMTDVGGWTDSGTIGATGVGALTIDGALPGGNMQVSNNAGNGINVNIANNGNGGSIIDNGNFITNVLASNPVNVIVNSPADQTVGVPPPLPPVPQLPAQLPMLTIASLNATTILGTNFTAQTAIQNLTIAGNGTNLATADGIDFTVNGTNTSIAGNILISNNSITGTGAGGTSNNGVQFNFTNSATVTGIDVIGNAINNNQGDGFQLISPWFNNVGSPAKPILALNFTGNQIDNNAYNGIEISNPNANTLQPIVNLTLTNNDVSTNGNNGVFFELAGVANSNATGTVNVVSNATANPYNGNQFNTFNNNVAGMGMYLTATNAQQTNTATLNLTIDGTGGQSQFTGNGNAGLGINLNGTSQVGTFSVSNAVFSGNRKTATSTAFFNGDGMAVYVQGTTNKLIRAQFNNATIGDATLQNTSFTGNAGSGFRLSTLESGSSDSLTLRNSTFSSNTGGDGITINRDAAIQAPGPYITNVWIDNNTIQANSANGININSGHADGADSYFISNNLIGSAINAGSGLPTNAALGNGGDGIKLFTVADADLNVIIGQTKAGAVGGNIITSNKGDGISANENINGDLGVTVSTIVNNSITYNTGNGIGIGDTTGSLHNVFIGTPDGTTQQSNVIDHNGKAGVFIDGESLTQTGSGSGASPNPATDFISFNSIQTNTGNGVTIIGAGFEGVNIYNNVNTFIVTGGGLGAVGNVTNINQGGINNNGGIGIQVDGSGATIVGEIGNTASGFTNDINHNAGDGIAFLSSNGNTSSLNIEDNSLNGNGFRGISILNASNSNTGAVSGGGVSTQTEMQILNNTVVDSAAEGIYIVNTSVGGKFGASSATQQGVDAPANNAMVVGNTWFNHPFLALNIDTNNITSNGQLANGTLYDTTGLVIRVGTSGSTSSFTATGGTATNLTSAQVAADAAASTLLFNMSNSGVAGSVANNTFGGNYGADATFGAFASTNAPPTTTGTWYYQGNAAAGSQYFAFGQLVSGLANQPAGQAISSAAGTYVSDPLARLDLSFQNNNGDGNALIATRPDTFSSANPAYYNNNEQVFKSRINNNPSGNGDTATGPFNSGTRDRNATRLAAQGATPTGNGNVSDINNAANHFHYSGTGTSTFRVNGTADGNSNFGANNQTFFGPLQIPTTPDGGSTFSWSAF